jgi:hypothetical protein
VCPASAATLETAEKFVDAFYAFEPAQLSALLGLGQDADNALYYQAWAQAAHYVVKDQVPRIVVGDGLDSEGDAGSAICAITVNGNFGTTLGYAATDTATLKVQDNKVSAVSFEGDDPLIFSVVYLWMTMLRSDVFEGPCENMFDVGNTSADCARAVAGAAKEFMSLWD